MRKILCVLAVLIGAAPQVGAQTAPIDRIALKLMAECKAASGGAALDAPVAFHETGTILCDGKSGAYEMYGDLHTLRTAGIHTLDGKIGGGGYDGISAWHVGSDGKVVVSTSPAELADQKMSAYMTVGGYFYPTRFPAKFAYLGRKSAGAKSFDVVEVTPEGASSADLWLDTATHRMARFTAAPGAEKAYTEILEYRVVAGTWIGFKNRQIEGPHKMVQTLATYDYVPLDPARFSPANFGR
jgi:hypothetical protein